MAYDAKYRIVDGLTFVVGETPKGRVISYGRSSSIALGNLQNKYSQRFNEKVHFRLGHMTDEKLENLVTVKHTKEMDWWYQLREKRLANQYYASQSQPVEEPKPVVEDKDSEFIYEVEDGVLKVYRLTLEKSYKVKKLPQTDTHNPFKLPDSKPTYPQGMPGYPQVMLNAED